MNTNKTLAVLCLLLCSGSLLAQGQSAITSLDNDRLSGFEEKSQSAVYVVQLRSPSVGDIHAENFKSRLALTVDSRPRLEKSGSVLQAHAAKLQSEQTAVLNSVGPGVQLVYSYKYGLNGFAARMSAAQAEKLAGQDDVLNVWEDEIRPLPTTDSRSYLGLFAADGGLRTERELDGEGIIIGVIDSGIDPDHPALSDFRPADRPSLCRSNWAETSLLGKWLCRRYAKEPDTLDFEAPENWNGQCDEGQQFVETDCNNKLIGARWFIDGAEQSGPIDTNEYRSPRDADGHGTHTATTAAGNRKSAAIFGTLIGNVEGMAPRARVSSYKACWLRPSQTRASCNTSDLVRAIDAAVADGVDIISYSVGSSMREITAADDVALMSATKAGVLAVVAAGNEGPALASIGSPAGAAWVITAAASTRAGKSSVESLEISSPPAIANRIATREALFSPLLSERDPIEGSLVLADDGDTTLPSGGTGITSDGCQPLTNSTAVSGNIALLQRSGCPFTTMVTNAEDAGAIAAIVYNIAGDPIVMFGETGLVDIPALMIGQADANNIIAELDDGNTVEVILEKSLLIESTDVGDTMATFSARGPAPVGDILKPDVTAPGVNIIAGFTADPANATPGENYAYLSGTSMSTPHVAGVAALLLQQHPNWSPAAIKSALMTTARQDLTLPGGIAPANPFDFGAGHIVPNDAFDPGLVYDISDDEYDAYACGIRSPAVPTSRCDQLVADGFSLLARDLNQPSIAISRLANTVTTSRRVSNPTDEAQVFNVQVAAPPGLSIEVSPSTLNIGPGESAGFDVTTTFVSGPLDLWRFGSLTWTNDDYAVRSPIAIKPAAITAPSEVTFIGGSGSETFPVTFGYNGSYSLRVHGLNAPFIQAGFVDNDPTKTFTPRTTDGVTLHKLGINQDQLFARFSLFDALTDGNDDLDMYVYYCGVNEDFCTPIGESGSATSQERFDIYRPPIGVYYVFVHGFETDDTDAAGAGSNYSLLAWTFSELGDAGNMTATGPALVNSGTTADVTVTWSGLPSNNLYLGGISHITPQAQSELTIVTIGN